MGEAHMTEYANEQEAYDDGYDTGVDWPFSHDNPGGPFVFNNSTSRRDNNAWRQGFKDARAGLLRRHERPPPPRQRDPGFADDAALAKARTAFEAHYVEAFGPPSWRIRTGWETIIGTEDAFRWVEHSDQIKNFHEQYYHTDIQQKWALFRAGWLAKGNA